MIFADLPNHTQMVLLHEAMALKKNYFTSGIDIIQQMKDVSTHIKQHLPDISDEVLNHLIFNSDQIYSRITHMPPMVLGMIQNVKT